MNINRDYLIILDVKSGEVDSPNIYYFNTDKNTSNLYIQMVIRETTVEATPIENALDYSIKANILKPNMVGKEVEGVLVNKEKAIYEFKLPADCTDFSGNAKIEFQVYTGNKIATSFATKFKVHGSVLTEQNKYIEDSSDYPILKELMAEVKVINETAHELDTTIRTLQADMIEANEEMKTNEVTRQANETTRVANEEARVEAERTRVNQEVARVSAEAIREEQEATRVADENERKTAENQRKANEEVRVANEVERKSAEATRVSAENTRAANEEIRQTNEANREVAEEIRRTNEQARITEHEAMRTEHEQMRTELNEVKAENAVLMENDKKIANRMTQVEISDKRQYVIMEGLMNSAGDGYLKIEDTGNDTTLYNSVEGFVDVKNITGNTMVNSIKNPDDELTLNADINTAGQSVTLTTAVDNGQVDVLAEGNTMVNVCDQQEAVAITKSYTVENGNHIALQGEYDGKARPVPTGNTLVNLAKKAERIGDNTADFSYDGEFYYNTKNENQSCGLNFRSIYGNFETGKILTIIVNNKSETTVRLISRTNYGFLTGTLSEGINIITLTTDSNCVDGFSVGNIHDNSGGLIKFSIVILEGDYTNKPIPDFFTGMKSSFEDKLVTQEMVDSGKELAENLGKYRVDYKVTGKNKIKPFTNMIMNDVDGVTITDNKIEGTPTSSGFYVVQKIYLYKDKTYNLAISNVTGDNARIRLMREDNKSIVIANVRNNFTVSKDGYYFIRIDNNGNSSTALTIESFQLEEGSTATAYEPYKEFTKTYYLNSPLLEGDTIEESNGNVYHVHRYNKVVLDGNIETGKDNITNIGLSSSTYTDTTLAFDITVTGSSLSSDTELVTLCDKLPNYPASMLYNTEVEGIGQPSNRIRIRLLKTKLSTENVDGFKQWLATNPLTVIYKLASPQYELISQSDTILTDSYVAGHLDFDTAVPVEKVDFNWWFEDLKYLYPNTQYNVQFESDNTGIMTMYFQGGIASENINVTKGVNKFILSTANTLPQYNSTRFNMVGIGFSASNIVVTEATDKDFGYFSGMKSVGELEENTIEIVSANGTDSTAEGYLSNSKQILLNEPLRAVGDTKDRFIKIDGKWYVEKNCAERNYETDDETNTSYKTDKVKTVYTLPSPTYEPVEIAPTVNTYTDVTHITNNSTIPMNMNIKNSGYEVIAKPSTKYTVVGITNGRIGDSTIVNGTITTPATITDNFLRPYGTGTTSKVMLLEGEPANIPRYFKGIKSVFEDKVTEDGKYACKVRVYNDLGNETVQTLYLDEPLYNTNNITIYNDKLGYWKNYDMRDYQDGDFGTYLTDMTKTVYQLAEPVFIPLIDNCPNWVIGTWDNCSIHFDSIIPLKDTRYRYTGNVPSVVTMSEDIDTVSSISDEQDALLIDMATELAVMKLTM